MVQTTLKSAPYHEGSRPPSNTWFLRPTQAFTPKGISIGSAVFAQLTVKCPYTLQWAATSPKIAPFPFWDRAPI